MPTTLTDRERRWLDALIVLLTVAAAFIVAGFIANLFFFLGDIVLVFFLAWLLAFILSPLVGGIARRIPGLPRVIAVVVVYAVLLASLTILVIVLAQALAGSISEFIAGVPQLRTDLPTVLDPWQQRLAAVGLGQIDLVAQAQAFLANLSDYAGQLVGPLQQLAVASLGAFGNLLFVLILSLYMVVDRDHILSFLFRVIPPAYAEEARLLESSVARSFGGFLRGQAVLGLAYAAVAAGTSGIFGLGYPAVTTTLSGVLMAIPFFGPFISWTPPVLVAVLVKPEVVLPTIVVMAIGWFVVMNLLQPRLMQEAVGIHPIVVLGSVLIGSKVGGIGGAIFGIPIAAVIAAFARHYLGRSRGGGSVAHRAAARVGEREGRTVRVPREPSPGLDPDVDPDMNPDLGPDLEPTR
ncbi:MAG: AI-2E family transporter [Candidatus Limnocylindrales bacterium]